MIMNQAGQQIARYVEVKHDKPSSIFSYFVMLTRKAFIILNRVSVYPTHGKWYSFVLDTETS